MQNHNTSMVVRAYQFDDCLSICSACLTSYTWLQKTKRDNEGKVSARFTLSFLLHKIWKWVVCWQCNQTKLFRMWLPLAMTLLCYVTFLPYLNDGPFASSVTREISRCEDNWWSTLLFVNNFADSDNPVSESVSIRMMCYLVIPQCLMWSSQISVLMQLHVASFLILITLIWWGHQY